MPQVARPIVLRLRESTGPIDTPWGSELRRIEKRVSDSDQSGIRARWESGQHILKRRQGKKLPIGLLQQLCAALEVSQRELSYRVQFALTCSTESAFSNAVAKSETWRQIIKNVLPTTRKRKAVTKPHIHKADVREVVVECRQFKTRAAIPSSIATDLHVLYIELKRLFQEEEGK